MADTEISGLKIVDDEAKESAEKLKEKANEYFKSKFRCEAYDGKRLLVKDRDIVRLLSISFQESRWMD